ncbi:MAG: cupredoxin domain-containing protein [Candidatus Magasanikbacteria bacterium]|nr:cupredoxin domain-containing protein [Candidatus Magasanikbacteria bacterium]
MKKHLKYIGFFTVRVCALALVSSWLLGAIAFGTGNSVVAQLGEELLALVIAVSLTVIAARQVLIYKSELTCMSGMMVGMTIGMLAGFLIGYIVGLSNGMFIGSIVGVLVGGGVGVLAGKSCGIMGVMEGMMAGLMAGTMGAILAVMMIPDHPIAFLWFLMAVCIALFGGLSVMIEREFLAQQKPSARVAMKQETISLISIISLIVLCVSFVMVYGSRGPLTVVQTDATTSVGAALSPAPTAAPASSDAVQRINIGYSNQNYNYSPSVIRVKKDVPVELIMDTSQLIGCTRTLQIPDLGVQATFSAGNNVIRFTPHQTGQFAFHCPMRMVNGTIIVE